VELESKKISGIFADPTSAERLSSRPGFRTEAAVGQDNSRLASLLAGSEIAEQILRTLQKFHSIFNSRNGTGFAKKIIFAKYF
jgi:hypothetical protein